MNLFNVCYKKVAKNVKELQDATFTLGCCQVLYHSNFILDDIVLVEQGIARQLMLKSHHWIMHVHFILNVNIFIL